MTKKAEALAIITMRKKLLRNLNILYPSPIQLSSLYRTLCCLDPTYDFSLFTKDISYLKDKGYIAFIDESIGGTEKFEDKVVKLTADGKEVAEGTDTDKALEI